MKLIFSILLLSMCPAWSDAQTTGSKGAAGGPPAGMPGGGGMPGGMSGSGSALGNIKLKSPGGAGSSGRGAGSSGSGAGSFGGGAAGSLGGGEGGDGYGGFAVGEHSGGSGMEQPLAFELNGKSYSASRTFSFHYILHSLRPTKQNVGRASFGGGYGDGAEGSGMGGGYGAGGMPGGGMGPPGMGAGIGYPGARAPSDSAGGGFGNEDFTPSIDIIALVIDGELVNDRTRIELAVRVQNEMGNFQPFNFTSLTDATFTPAASESEIKLVSDIIRQSIWMADALKLIRRSKGQGDVAASNEKLLKQLLAEQYDTQIARREMEAESIKKRLDALQEELTRRKLAKERVVEVQWGRLILDAQGLLNKE